ncbi:Gfo/Idh/MocA family oxidoreductase [Pirellulales bacterium]|nr:Gfo/Idh/MocA family oxidoreductase [Pirellulales bacterium]
MIGTGRAGMIHARNFASGNVDGARLVALSDPLDAGLQVACRETGVSTSFADWRVLLTDTGVEAIIVATPTAYHREIVVAAAEAGKHILCEKPMAMNAEECNAMNEAADRANVKLQIGFMRRFDESFLEAKRRVEAGEIGAVVQVKSLTHGPSTPKAWMYDLQKSNGPLAEVNSHDIDTLRWFTGSEFSEVYAIGGNFRSPEATAEFPDFYDNVSLTARFRNGMQGFIGGAQGVQYGYDARAEILGEKGLITIGDLAGSKVVTHTADGMTTPVVRSWKNLFLDAYREEDADFVRAIREDRVPRVTGRDGKAAVEVVNAGNRSIVERKPIPLPP